MKGMWYTERVPLVFAANPWRLGLTTVLLASFGPVTFKRTSIPYMQGLQADGCRVSWFIFVVSPVVGGKTAPSTSHSWKRECERYTMHCSTLFF